MESIVGKTPVEVLEVIRATLEEKGMEMEYEAEHNIDALAFILAEGDVYGSEGTFLEKTFGYKHLMSEGGGEGGSEYCEGVFQLGDKYYQTSYSYYSHDGYYYDDAASSLKEVKPVQKMVTVYE
ncbi:hypothetical protein [Vibrio phage RYC]|nr:hypothetical protein [Vibrio phage RYC]